MVSAGLCSARGSILAGGCREEQGILGQAVQALEVHMEQAMFQHNASSLLRHAQVRQLLARALHVEKPETSSRCQATHHQQICSICMLVRLS